MIKITSAQELRETFRAIDQAELQLPTDLSFPLLVKDYISWIEPSGHRAFLVFEDQRSKAPLGIVFRRTHETGEPVARMCEWCHSVRGGSAVGLLAASASRTRQIGIHVCRDLSCKANALGSPGVNDLRESLSGQQKVMRMLSRMTDFARKNLF